MAPTHHRHHIQHRGVDGLLRDASTSVGNDNGGSDIPGNFAPRYVSTAPSTVAPSTYLGIGLGVGVPIVVALIIMVVMTIRKRIEHRRLVEALEVEHAVQSAQRQEVGDVPRPNASARCGNLVPLHARAGWDALASDETLHEPELAAQAKSQKRASVPLPKKFKQKGIPLKKLKRLTAILESPRSKATNSPVLPLQEVTELPASAEKKIQYEESNKAYTLRQVDDEDVFVCPGSPKPDVLPSFAIRSPGRCGAGIAINDNPKAPRSQSVGALTMSIPADALLGQTARLSRPSMHMRSISLGAPMSRPPSGPVPPLPIIGPHNAEGNESMRQGVCISRMSSSSQESTSSSVLVTSPFLKRHQDSKAGASPTVEDVVAEDDSASLKTVTKRQWKNPLVAGPRPLTTTGAKGNEHGMMQHASIRSNIARYSNENADSHRLSSGSVGSAESRNNRLSIPRVGLADQVSISRVSSANSVTSFSGVQKITTPCKPIRTSVSASGSPVERKKTGVLRDISANSLPMLRQLSNATQDSGRSSNGNPFQWDQPLPKPSALKGSPNARKGHRRQNCVRISTLTPQILGPPPSRPTSPSIMHGIEEESGNGEDAAMQPGVRFVSNQRLSRPPSASSFAPNLRIQTLRASLTPSSPTLSAWTAYQELGLPSQASDSQLSASPVTRSGSRQSDHSSTYSIPSFPSPSKATVQLHQPVPEFYLSRPSTDVEDQSSSSFSIDSNLHEDDQSRPPLPLPRQEVYDPAHPAWPIVSIPTPQNEEYDPASPAWDDAEPERSSPIFLFATNLMEAHVDEEISPQSRPTSCKVDMPDTPPCSPKTMPEGFKAFFDKQDSGSKTPRASEKLTSANASSIMSRISTQVDFPGAPILLPPEESLFYSPTTPPRTTSGRQRSVSNAAHLKPMRPAPPPPLPENDACVPSPLHLSGKTSPNGPRSQPAQSVLKNAMALRRMNSEVSEIANRESRRYVRLGREASPLLPWIGSPDPSESCCDMNDLFDFDFATDATSGAEKNPSALDEIDMSEVERKLDGALAGFDALPIDETPREKRVSSVWEDGEKYWERQETTPEFTFAPSSPLPMSWTPKRKVDNDFLATPRSIQNTPKSLYDSDGFLRT